jgi:uncharacterized membrane protein YkvA (DUF1232 family)
MEKRVIQGAEGPMENTEAYEKEYSEEKFWQKLATSALAAGRKVVAKALTLYYAARSKDTPLWAKAAIFGALGYFISPIDAIPDAIPVVGYSDDLAVLAAAAAAVAKFLTGDHTKQAEETLQKWFGKGKGPVPIPPSETTTAAGPNGAS